MSLISQIRQRVLRPKLEALDLLYRETGHAQGIQLDRLNGLWGRYAEKIPYYRSMIDRGELPRQFVSLEEYAAKMPIINRRILADNCADFTVEGCQIKAWRTTGGSTGEPLRMPATLDEFKVVAPNQWYARSCYGVSPADRLFLIWGHSHLLGTGVQGALAAAKRRLSDKLLGYCRVSAYHLSDQALLAAADRLLHFKPRYIYGYSTAIDRFARVNRDRSKAFRALGLKLVQCTSESFRFDDSREVIEDVFGCPVAMEYGSVETGVMAYEVPSKRGYCVFWNDFIIEGVNDQGGGVRQLLVTTLTDRAVPLFRYELGDLLKYGTGGSGLEPWPVGLTSFLDLAGRCNDGLELNDGTRIHSELFTHCVRHITAITGYQVIGDGAKVRLDYLAPAGLTLEEKQSILDKLARIDKRLGNIPIERVAELQKTVAGKTPLVINQRH